MSDHIAADIIKDYLERKLKPAELLRADEHLAECDPCLRKAEDLKRFSGIAEFEFFPAASDETGHLSYEQLEAYVDERSDAVEREIADVHLQSCAGCKTSLEDLFETKNLIVADLRKDASAPVGKTPFSKIGKLFSAGYLLRFGFAAAGVVIAASGLFWLISRDSTTEVAIIPAPSNAGAPLPTAQNSPAPDSQQNTNVNVTGDTNSNTNAIANLPPPAEEKVEKLPPRYEAEVRRVLAENRLSFPAELNDLKNSSGTLMSGAGSVSLPFALSNPVGRIVLSNRPQFRWRPLGGAESYTVSIYDQDFNEVARSAQLSAARWQIDKPLARGRTYIWQVTAVKNGEEIKSPVRPAPDARFKILDAKTADELSRLNRQYKGENLFLGIMYAGAGLLEEAESEFRKELARNPNSKQARKFLREVRAKRK